MIRAGGPRRPRAPRPCLPDWLWERRQERILIRLQEQIRASRRRQDRAEADRAAYWDRVEAIAGDWERPEARRG